MSDPASGVLASLVANGLGGLARWAYDKAAGDEQQRELRTLAEAAFGVVMERALKSHDVAHDHHDPLKAVYTLAGDHDFLEGLVVTSLSGPIAEVEQRWRALLEERLFSPRTGRVTRATLQPVLDVEVLASELPGQLREMVQQKAAQPSNPLYPWGQEVQRRTEEQNARAEHAQFAEDVRRGIATVLDRLEALTAQKPESAPRALRAAPRDPGALPPVWDPRVPGHNPFFTGRDAALSGLRAALTAGASNSDEMVQPRALVGLGGVGKSQMAAEYAWAHRDAFEAVCWVPAEDPVAAKEAYAQLADALPLSREQATRAASPLLDVRVGAVRDWFERTQDRWLLILDNADSPPGADQGARQQHRAIMDALIPRAVAPGGAGEVLLTSQETSWQPTAEPVHVPELTVDAAAEFLQARTGRTGPTDARLLAEDLGGLPLALEQAAAFVQTAGISFNRYRQALKRSLRRLAREPTPPRHPMPVVATIEIALERLQKREPTGAELLNVCAYFAPDEIPRGLLYVPPPAVSAPRVGRQDSPDDALTGLPQHLRENTHAIRGSLRELHLNTHVDRDAVDDAVGAAVALSLLSTATSATVASANAPVASAPTQAGGEHDEDARTSTGSATRGLTTHGADGIRVHRLVQRVLRDRIERAAQQNGREYRWVVGAVLLAWHAMPPRVMPPPSWPIMTRMLAHVLVVADHIDRLTTDDNGLVDANPGAVALTESLLMGAVTYLLRRGQPAAAAPLADQALQLYSRSPGADRQRFYEIQRKRGAVAHELENLDAAVSAYHEAYRIAVVRRDEEFTKLRDAYVTTLSRRGRPSDVTLADRLLSEALSDAQAADPSGEALAIAIARLGQHQQTHYDAALAHQTLTRAHELYSELVDPKPDQQRMHAIVHRYLGFAARDLGDDETDPCIQQQRYEEHLAHEQQSLAILQEYYAGPSAGLAAQLANVAMGHELIGEYAEAVECLEEAVEQYTSAMSPQHKRVSDMRADLERVRVRRIADELCATGQYAEAEAIVDSAYREQVSIHSNGSRLAYSLRRQLGHIRQSRQESGEG